VFSQCCVGWQQEGHPATKCCAIYPKGFLPEEAEEGKWLIRLIWIIYCYNGIGNRLESAPLLSVSAVQQINSKSKKWSSRVKVHQRHDMSTVV